MTTEIEVRKVAIGSSWFGEKSVTIPTDILDAMGNPRQVELRVLRNEKGEVVTDILNRIIE